MLPVSRVIGHKDWAPGRKSDPLYSMSWRRSRVAAFTPGEDEMTKDQFLAFLRDPAVRAEFGHILAEAPIGNTGEVDDKGKPKDLQLWLLLAALYRLVVLARPTRAHDKGSTYRADPLQYAVNADGMLWDLLHVDLPELRAHIEALAGTAEDQPQQPNPPV
jgi:hypothetical protein